MLIDGDASRSVLALVLVGRPIKQYPLLAGTKEGEAIVYSTDCRKRIMRAPLALALVLAALMASPPARSVEPPSTVHARNGVDDLVTALEKQPRSIRIANDLRRYCRSAGVIDTCIEVLDKLVRDYPDAKELRYNAALAYVDKLPGLSIYRQGWLSTRSMEHVTPLIDADSGDWLAYYIRGMNHLYWPRWFRHTDRAIQDLEHCVRISSHLPLEQARPFHVLAYLALGDGFAKAGRIEEAKKIWREGLSVYPSGRLRERLVLPVSDLPAYIDVQRDLDKPIETDLVFLWEKTGL